MNIKSSETTQVGDPRQLGEAIEEPQGSIQDAPPRSTAVPSTLFGKDTGVLGAQVQMSQPKRYEIPDRPADPGRPVVVARPVMGQATPRALEPYPEIDQVIQKQVVGVGLSNTEVQAIHAALASTLTRISAPENSGSSCVKNLGPGAVEKAATLLNKMTAYIASNSAAPFSGFTADELGGADRVLSCAGSLAPAGAPSTGLILAIAVLGLSAFGVYYLASPKKRSK